MRSALIVVCVAACGTEVPGPPAALLLVQPAQRGVVATTVSVAIRALDAEDRPIPGLRLVAAAGSATLAASEVVTADTGIATFEMTFGTAAVPEVLDVSVAGGGIATQFVIPVDPGPATTGHFLQPSLVMVGTLSLALPVVAFDTYGNAHPDPPLLGEPTQAVADSGRWLANVLGRVRFRLDLLVTDSLDVYVQVPTGPYRIQFRVADTLFIETGVFTLSTADASTICTVPPTAHAVRVLDATGVRRIRSTTGGFEDTLNATLRVGALVHAMDVGMATSETQIVRFQPHGRPAPTTCSGTFFVRAWKFALFGALQDSLVITPN